MTLTQKIEPGDTAIIGDTAYAQEEGGVIRQEVTILEKRYRRDGVVARIALLEIELAKFRAILTEIDK